MVNPILPGTLARLRAAAEPETPAGRAPAGAAPRSGVATDSLSLSPGANRLPEALLAGPPVDQALVDRIGGAIARGEYPIDPERIAEAIFLDVTDLRG